MTVRNWGGGERIAMIELHRAAMFDCPECGRENFVRMVTPELSPEEESEAPAALGIEPWEEGNFVMAPPRVQCQFCGHEDDTEET